MLLNCECSQKWRSQESISRRRQLHDMVAILCDVMLQRGPKITYLVLARQVRATFGMIHELHDAHRTQILRVTFAIHNMRQIHAGCASHLRIRRNCCVHLRVTRDVTFGPLCSYLSPKISKSERISFLQHRPTISQ
jgi:hypothetical protein